MCIYVCNILPRQQATKRKTGFVRALHSIHSLLIADMYSYLHGILSEIFLSKLHSIDTGNKFDCKMCLEHIRKEHISSALMTLK